MILDLALIFILGMVLFQVSHFLHLPKVVLFLILGMVLGSYGLGVMDPIWEIIGADLRQLALLVIIIRAGLSLNLNDLKQVGIPALLLGFIPATVDMLSVMMLSHWILGLPLLEAWLLGSIVSAVSPAIVVPFMLDMMKKGLGQSSKLPQMIMAGASLDDIYAMIMFTLALSVNISGHLSLNMLMSVPISLFTGILVGVILGLVLVKIFKRFHYRDTYKVMLLIGVALLLRAFETAQILPFSSLISVLSLSMSILFSYPNLSKRLLLKFEKVWLFNELILFVLIGALVNLNILPKIGIQVIIIVLISLILRSIGTFSSVLKTTLTPHEKRFVVLSYLPKATVQASLGALPLALGIPSGELILAVSVLSILLTAPLGAWFMEWTIKKASID